MRLCALRSSWKGTCTRRSGQLRSTKSTSSDGSPGGPRAREDVSDQAATLASRSSSLCMGTGLTVDACVRRACMRYGSMVALVDGSRSLTYPELDARLSEL